MSVIGREWRDDERAKWDAMTEDARFDMHMTVRANRADAKQAADRLEHQLEGAVFFTDEERERVLWWLRRPVHPGPMKDLDERILRKLNEGDR